jgi:hypothetical protein
VNLPRQPRGVIWTRASVRHYDGRIVPTQDPLGRDLFWFTIAAAESTEEGTDRWAVEQDWISMTPLRLDLTDEGQLQKMREQRPLDSARAAIASEHTSSPEAAKSVREDEASHAITKAESPAVPTPSP